MNPPTDTKKKKLLSDLLLIGGIGAVALIAALCLFLFRAQGDTVTVEVGGEVVGVYPLGEDLTLEIPSGEGHMNRLVIRDGEAFMEAANCPDGICAAHRPISHSGEQIICLPHKVVVTVKKAAETTPDIVA